MYGEHEGGLNHSRSRHEKESLATRPTTWQRHSPQPRDFKACGHDMWVLSADKPPQLPSQILKNAWGRDGNLDALQHSPQRCRYIAFVLAMTRRSSANNATCFVHKRASQTPAGFFRLGLRTAFLQKEHSKHDIGIGRAEL